MARTLCIPGTVLLLAALVLSFLISISLPSLPALDFVRIGVDTNGLPDVPGVDLSNVDFRMGIWATCTYDGTGAHSCTARALGYEVGVLNLLDPSKTGVVTSAWTRGLVLHPIATAFIFIAFLTSFVEILTIGLATFLLSSFAAFVALIAFIIDIALFAHVHSIVSDAHVSLVVKTAPGFWLSFVSVVGLIAASVTFIFGRRRESLSSQSTSYPLQSSKKFWSNKF